MTKKHPINKVDVAINQLRTAIQLYNKSNFISSITLAGASEEILGKIASKISNSNALLEEKIAIDQIAEIFNKTKPSLKKIIKARYRTRNDLKHNDTAHDSKIVDTDLKFQAEVLIIGAIRNYMLIFNKEPNDRVIKKFWNWISL
jgi:hypothetical protein